MLNFHDIIIKRPISGAGLHAIILDKSPSSDQHLIRDIGSLGERSQQSGTDAQTETVNEAARLGELSQDPLPLAKSQLSDAYVAGMPQSVTNDSKLDFIEGGKTADGHAPIDEQYEDPSGQIAQISISHDGEYATAVCLAAQEPMDGDVGGEAAARNYL